MSIISLYNGPLPSSIKEYRLQAAKKLRQGVLNNKLKDFVFDLNITKYKEFTDNFVNGRVGLDPNFYLADALAQCMYRPVIIISTLERHNKIKYLHLTRNQLASTHLWFSNEKWS